MALSRIRTLSRRVAQLMRADSELGFSFEMDGIEELLLSLASDLARARVDLMQFPLVYYFYSDQNHAALPKVLPFVVKLAESGMVSDKPMAMQRPAAVLQLAPQDLADILRERFVKVEGRDCASVFEAYAQHHRPA